MCMDECTSYEGVTHGQELDEPAGQVSVVDSSCTAGGKPQQLLSSTCLTAAAAVA